MADDLGRAQAAESAADRQRPAAGQPVEKAGGIQVSGPGGVYDAGDRPRRDPVRLAAGDDDAALGSASQSGDRDAAAHRLGRLSKGGGPVQRTDFGLVGEQDVDLALDQFAKRFAMA